MTRKFYGFEFACPCGECPYSNDELSLGIMDKKLLHELLIIQAHLNNPIVILSGLRCQMYDSKFQKGTMNSLHTKGEAVDITIPKQEEDKLFYLLSNSNVLTYVARYNAFIHVERSDVRKRYVKVKDCRKKEKKE